jgi:hypothetical protein
VSLWSACISVVVSTAVFAGLAHADDKPVKEPTPDPAAQLAGEEANLESTARRKGFTFGISIGPSVTIGGGTGTGGAVSLKLGQVAGPRTVISFELNGSGQLLPNNYTSLLGVL